MNNFFERLTKNAALLASGKAEAYAKTIPTFPRPNMVTGKTLDAFSAQAKDASADYWATQEPEVPKRANNSSQNNSDANDNPRVKGPFTAKLVKERHGPALTQNAGVEQSLESQTSWVTLIGSNGRENQMLRQTPSRWVDIAQNPPAMPNRSAPSRK